MMVLAAPMMPQQQPPQAMDQGQGHQGQDQAGPGGWGSAMQPQQPAHDQTPSGGSAARTPTGSKAFKIFNPKTNEEVKGKDGGSGEFKPSGSASGSGPKATSAAPTSS